MTKRISVDGERYNQLKEIFIHGVKVKGALSPYDVPREAKVTYDQGRKEFRISFVYLTPDEPKSEKHVSREIAIFLGQSSGKVYDIVVRGQEPATIKALQVRLVTEVGDLARQSESHTPPNYISQLNLLAAKKFLEEKEEIYAIE